MSNGNFKEITAKLNIANPIGGTLTVFVGFIGYLGFAEKFSIWTNIIILLILMLTLSVVVLYYVIKKYKILVVNYNEGQKNRRGLSSLYTKSTQNEDRLKNENHILQLQLNFLLRIHGSTDSPGRKEIIEALELEKIEVHNDGR